MSPHASAASADGAGPHRDVPRRRVPAPPAGLLSAGGAVGRFLRAPFTRRARAEFAYAMVSLPLGVVGFTFTVGSLGAGCYLAITFLGLPMISASTLGVRRLGAANRGLVRRLLSVQIADPPPFHPRPGLIGWIRSGLTDAVGWRARAYLVLKLPVSVAGCVVAAYLWLVGLFYVTYPLWWEILGRLGHHIHLAARQAGAVAAPLPVGSFHVATLPDALLVATVGVAVVLAAPWGTRAVIGLDWWLVRRLLGPMSLSERLRDLERARAHAVDDSAAQLRRIERDLHDGAQAQLLAVDMRLSLAKEKLGGGKNETSAQLDVKRALELVDTAQRTAREAMTELRQLARGIHPPILDKGLDTALATLAARSTVPVELVTDVPQRPSAAIETIAYFCAAELLANVAKHSGARRATLEALHVTGLVQIRVTDDGVGGASLEAGGGLCGLTDRVQTVDGRLEISSPAGGPTVVTVALPSHA